MKLEVLKKDLVQEFVDYCKKHLDEVDDSFLMNNELENFTVSEENPTYIIKDDQNKVIAAASLIIDDYHRRGKRGRFRIFHSEVNDHTIYKMLHESILKHTAELEKVFIFLQVQNKQLISYFAQLNFVVERYSFVLVRENLQVPTYQLPEGYEIRNFRQGEDEAVWCKIRNASFLHLLGHDIEVTPESISKMIQNIDYIEGGLRILYHHDKPIGVIRGSNEMHDDTPTLNIGPIAVLPEYQGKGLGRCLLREMLSFAKQKGFKKTVLCVNEENNKAKSLYIQEGFKEVIAVVCYKYDL